MKSRKVISLILAGSMVGSIATQANAFSFNPITLCTDAWTTVKKKVNEARDRVGNFYKTHKKTGIAAAITGAVSLVAGTGLLAYKIFKKKPQPKVPTSSFFSIGNGLKTAGVFGLAAVLYTLGKRAWNYFGKKGDDQSNKQIVLWEPLDLPYLPSVLSHRERDKRTRANLRKRLTDLMERGEIHVNVPRPMDGTSDSVLEQLMRNSDKPKVATFIEDATKYLNMRQETPLALEEPEVKELEKENRRKKLLAAALKRITN